MYGTLQKKFAKRFANPFANPFASSFIWNAVCNIWNAVCNNIPKPGIETEDEI